MTPLKFLVFLFLLSLSVPACLLPLYGEVSAKIHPEPVTYSLIQVGILQQAERLTVTPWGNYSVLEIQSGASLPLQSHKPHLIEPRDPGQIQVGPHVLSGDIRLVPQKAHELLNVNRKSYRGILTLKPNANGTLTVINELGLEEYLYGVLPGEMHSEWPLEALKAQAVVARTFALLHKGGRRSEGFDLSDDANSQVYNGAEPESPKVRKAIEETQDEVLSFGGKLLRVYYHSCCAGHTTTAGEVWGGTGKSSALRGVRCGNCASSPHHKWGAYFATQDILRALQGHDFLVTQLQAIRIGSRDLAGYAKTLRMHTDRGIVEVKTSYLRTWLGTADLKSNFILRILPRSKGFEFLGQGWGHGVGLCQWGARRMAQNKRDYRMILRLYFPRAQIARWVE